MGKSISINQTTLGIVLLIALGMQYLKFFSLPLIGEIMILVVAILLLLK